MHALSQSNPGAQELLIANLVSSGGGVGAIAESSRPVSARAPLARCRAATMLEYLYRLTYFIFTERMSNIPPNYDGAYAVVR